MPFLVGPNVDVGDASVLSPPVASPPPTLDVAAPPALVAPAPIDVSDVFGRAVARANPDLPTIYGGGGTVPGVPDVSAPVTDDFAAAQAEADANTPDLSSLPPFDLIDPFGERTLAASNPPLKGDAAAEAITELCAVYKIDDHACFANALSEAPGGAIGDGGYAYGPFQDHLTEFAGRPFYGKGKNNDAVNAWAWSRNGIEYSIRQMAHGPPAASGLQGHAAVYAIVYGYERPQDKPGAYRVRSRLYDALVARGAGELAYVASQLHGPTSGGATGKIVIPPAPKTPPAYVPAGVNAQWRDFVDVFQTGIPKAHSKVQSFGLTLKDVFK